MLARALPSKHTQDRCVRMEEELKCPRCSGFFCDPLVLPCSHSLCTGCAEKIQEPSQNFISQLEDPTTPVIADSETKDFPDIDKVSLVSETDSGVVCNSRPNSYVGTASISNIFQAVQGSVYGIKCPVCKKNVFLDENGHHSLPKNKVLEIIVDKYCGDHNKKVNVFIKCELCDQENKAASIMCEQCEVFYCENCKNRCHPSRGSLAKHNLVDPVQGKAIIRAKNKGKEAKCREHVEEHLSMYCLVCKTPVCYVCHQEGRHVNHEVQALGAMSKSHKTELSQTLQALSERAKAGTEFIQHIRGMSERVHGNSVDFEAVVVAQCDALIEAIKYRKQELIESVAQEKDLKTRVLKDQVSHCTSLLQRTTGLLHFCIEVLKESDAASFLQVSSGLLSRVSVADQNFNKEMEFVPRISPEFELTLDNKSVLHAIQTMNFFQMKEGVVAPNKPMILPGSCSAENNSVTIAWQPHIGNVVENYSLELDDGNGGDFRVVYVGRETICTVDGLHFNSTYFARVKASNHAGDSDYSEPISLQTAEVAWFQFDPSASHPDIIFSNENLTATCNSFDHRVILGSTGFSKGVHYWEIVIDRYDNHTDPAVGIARFDIDKMMMLGKDDKGWGMYIDDSRSWFMHQDSHSDRTEGGIKCGSVIGVLLDLDKRMLSYYVDEEPHGPIAFTNLLGVFFPAISINRNVQVTLRTGIEPPVESDHEDDST
ncbi:E3 ubiquitin-protein ligase TRIM9-like isoform X1 [Pecten maximus]|uniref:E3 ubiquitin-protein ligase TRIM9-like isoform X1 n=1 Tax=Pecten maximus TaxID=6579 RepID=UPI001458DAF6|nr:E3 ubiquitin-protein ligase TRIM9-like isoform X1 [Pecten maximus]